MLVNPTNETSSQRLFWVDCEFTGLDINQGHKIIEIGALVTDLGLTEIDSYQSFVNYGWDYVKTHMDQNPWWTGRDTDQERMRLGQMSAEDPTKIDGDLSELVQEYFGTTKPPVTGNSVGNDKKHIDDQFKELSEHLSYQVIDVSTLKILVKKYLDTEYAGKHHRHFALDDIRESVDELKFLLDKLGILDLSRLAIKDC